MKKLITFVLVAFLLASCKKDSCPYTDINIVAPASEVAALQDYFAGIGINPTQHSSGIFYTIDQPGSGKTPTVCSQVTIKYSGYLTNGVKFDESLTGVTFDLGRLIVGWQKGLPLIKEGGKITLYIPPSLGYCSQPFGDIPANSALLFSVELVDVQ